MNIKFRQNPTTRLFDLNFNTRWIYSPLYINITHMGEGIRLAGSSNAVESPTREGSGAFGTTLSNNEASNVLHSNEIKKDFTLNQGFSLNKGELCPIMWSNVVSWFLYNTQGRQEFPRLIYTRTSCSGGSSSCGYSESESKSRELAPQTSDDTDPCIRSPSSSQTNPKSDSQVSRVSQNCIDCEEVATPFDKIDNINDTLLVITDVLHSKYLKKMIFTLISTFGLIIISSSTCSLSGADSSRHQYREYISI